MELSILNVYIQLENSDLWPLDQLNVHISFAKLNHLLNQGLIRSIWTIRSFPFPKAVMIVTVFAGMSTGFCLATICKTNQLNLYFA